MQLISRRGRLPIMDVPMRTMSKAVLPSNCDHGRHWPGCHHHVTLATLAYAFLRAEQARIKKTSGETLPQARRLLQTVLIGLAGFCP